MFREFRQVFLQQIVRMIAINVDDYGVRFSRILRNLAQISQMAVKKHPHGLPAALTHTQRIDLECALRDRDIHYEGLLPDSADCLTTTAPVPINPAVSRLRGAGAGVCVKSPSSNRLDRNTC